jgi:hypothetical protein
MNPGNFFTELKRRNVYRAAVAYGVVAWFLTQLTTQVFPFFEIRTAAIRFVIIALGLGFPIAMCLSWLYEFTPEGNYAEEATRLDPKYAEAWARLSIALRNYGVSGTVSSAGDETEQVLAEIVRDTVSFSVELKQGRSTISLHFA